MATLADALARAAQTPARRRGIERILDELEPDQADALIAAMRSTMGAAKIAGVLREAGYDVGRGAVEGWRGRNVTR